MFWGIGLWWPRCSWSATIPMEEASNIAILAQPQYAAAQVAMQSATIFQALQRVASATIGV